VLIGKYFISPHALLRMAQRNLGPADLAAVLRHGHTEHRAGATFYFLGERDVPEGMERALERLVGTTIVIEGGRVSTVYRNRRALSRIRRKSKWHRSRKPCARAGGLALGA
jgi:hypothetical protein